MLQRLTAGAYGQPPNVRVTLPHPDRTWLLQRWEFGPRYLLAAAAQRLALAQFGHPRLGADSPAAELDYLATTVVAELVPFVHVPRSATAEGAHSKPVDRVVETGEPVIVRPLGGADDNTSIRCSIC